MRQIRWTIPALSAGFALALAGLTGVAEDKDPNDLPLKADAPLCPKPQAGNVTGAILPPDRVKTIRLVSRATGKSYRCTEYDPNSGQFRFASVPGDASYDVCVTTGEGKEYQGVDLSFVDARLLRLADIRRRKLGLKRPRDYRFDQSDANSLLDWVKSWDDFLEDRRVLYIRGDGPKATMLVELMRTREFYASGGKLVWRVELWYFREKRGGWDRLPDQERTLRRERVSPEEFRKISVEYYPALTAFVDPNGQSEPVRFRLPKKPDASRGRPAGTDPKIEANPHILGLPEESTSKSAIEEDSGEGEDGRDG